RICSCTRRTVWPSRRTSRLAERGAVLRAGGPAVTVRPGRPEQRTRARYPLQPLRRDFDLSDAACEPVPGPPPEAVFDQVTGPYRRQVRALSTAGAGEVAKDS